MLSKIVGILFIILITDSSFGQETVSVNGELKALKTDNFSPPKIKNIWKYTISFMAADGSIVKTGMPILMFKTDEVQTKLMTAQGNLDIKKSEIKNNLVYKAELFANKKLIIEQKKMELDKATRKSELPQSLLAKNDYSENQLKFALAKKEYQWAQDDYRLTKLKSMTEEQIINAAIKKLESEVKGFEAAIKSMKMSAKSDGVVMHKTGWQGNKFAIGDSVYGGQRVIEVANLKQIIAKLEVSENSIKHIAKEQKVKIVLDSLPDKEFWGTIQSLANVVRVKSKHQPAKILDAVVFIDKVDTELMRPGMRLSATIQTGASK